MRRKRKQPNILESIFLDAYKFVFGGCLLVALLLVGLFVAGLVYTSYYSKEILNDVSTRTNKK